MDRLTRAVGIHGFLHGFLLYWFPAAFAITVLSALVYGTVQQSYRQAANDPQIEMAQDAAAQLEAGQQPQSIAGTITVDIARSLAPYMIVYDDAGQVTASSARLNGQTPTLPNGVLDYVRQSGEDRITWQPQEGVRSAAVISRSGGSHPGFVLAGRSLREVEERESRLTLMTFGAWAIALVCYGLLLALVIAVSSRAARPTA